MSEISVLAIDLAKNSFQVCGVKADGVVVFNKSVSRSRLIQLLSDQKPFIVAMEACATSHHWGPSAVRGSGAVDCAHGLSVARSSGAVWRLEHGIQAVSQVGQGGRIL